MEDSLDVILARRATMTKLEAESHNFTDAVLTIINNHLELLKEYTCHDTPFSPHLLAKIELKLQKVLGPWFTVAIFSGVNPELRMPLVVLNAEKRDIPVPADVEMETLPNMLKHGVLLSVHVMLEEVRASILRGESLQFKQHEFAVIFRDYLETGDEARMPFLAYGTKTQREMTYLELRRRSKIICPPGRNCMDEPERIAAFQKSDGPDAARERDIIRSYFTNNESLSNGVASESMSQAAGGWRNNPGQDPLPVSLSDVDTLIGMGFKKDKVKFALEMTGECK